MINTLAALKRDCDKYTWELIRHDGGINPRVAGPRRVKTKQANAIEFTPAEGFNSGSWLHWHKAGAYRFGCSNDTDKPLITVALKPDFSEVMIYQLTKI